MKIRPEQIQRARAVDLVALAQAHGLELRRMGRSWSCPCPFHDEATPGGFRLFPDTGGFKCFSCQGGGDAIDLVRHLGGLDFAEAVRALTGDEGPPRRPVRERKAPPRAEGVEDVWRRAGPVTADEEAVAWLEGRTIDPARVEDFDLARIARAPLPSWARWRGSWLDTGHRLLVPLFDAAGRLASLRARRVVEGDTPKNLAPSGVAATRLVMADALGVRMLRGERLPRDLRVVIAEGESDYLVWAGRLSDAHEDPPAVLGIMSGSWGPEFAARVPRGATVCVRTHLDETGDKYAREIIDSLGGRARVLRPRREVARV